NRRQPRWLRRPPRSRDDEAPRRGEALATARVPAIRHLYFHIPFCPKLCPYCSFYVEIGSEHKNRAFLDALLRDVELAADQYDLRPETIYFGGGTPSALHADQLEYLLGVPRHRLD